MNDRVGERLTGGCACGKVRFETSRAPIAMFLCHCRDCQRATGSLYAANVWFYKDDVVLSGQLNGHSTRSDKGTSSIHEFCQACGSPIGMRTEVNNQFQGLRATAFEGPVPFQPDASIFMKNSWSWEVFDEGLPLFEGDVPEDFARRKIGPRLRLDP